uniref:EF-hand domain-containing protein n=1 Tax=Sphenodon punctatus TaxID=8508 RepID=A0A8D0GXI0_SPHPU
MEEQRVPAKSRKLGSNRRKQLKGMLDDAKTSPILEEKPFSSEIINKVQDFFQECDKDQKGFITRADMQKLKREAFPCSAEELELVFDCLDTDRNGSLTTEEFTTGLRHFLSSQTSVREHRRRKATARWGDVSPQRLPLEEADDEERKHFTAFINQLGAENIFEERVSDHHQEVQRLYEELEQQIDGEKQRLQHESEARSHSHSLEVQKALDSRDRTMHHFITVQKELKTQVHSLSDKQYTDSAKNQELRQTNEALENQLQQIHHQLQETQGHMDAMRARVSQLHSEEGRDRPMADISSKALPPPQDTLSTKEKFCSELEIKLGSRRSEHTPASSSQQASADVTVVTEADSGPRTRVISIEEDPLPGFVEEGQTFFLQEFSAHSSLLREMDDAITALSKVSQPQSQKASSCTMQENESLHPIQQSETRKGISVTLTDQDVSQGKSIPQEPTQAQLPVPEGKQTGTPKFAAQAERHKLEPARREGTSPNVPLPVVSRMATQANVCKQETTQGNAFDLEMCLPALSELARQDVHKVSRPRDVLVPGIGLHTASEPALGKKSPPEAKAAEKAAEPWEAPEHETPPALFPHPGILHTEHTGSEAGIALPRDSQLGGTPKPQDTGELNMEVREGGGGARIPGLEEKGKVSVKVNEAASAKLEEQKHQVTPITDPPREAPKATAGILPDPDHFYNVLFVGDSNVGKTSFLYRLHEDSFSVCLTATVGMDYRVKNFSVDNKCFALRLWDTAGQERYHSITKQFFRKADGVVLMYDITSEYSFADVRYWLSCIREGVGDGVVILLIGNKTDCAAERRVSTEEGDRLAKEHGLLFYECSAASSHNVSESMVSLVRLLKVHEDQLKHKAVEVPVLPKKKRGCCT